MAPTHPHGSALRVAAVQMTSSADRGRNIAAAEAPRAAGRRGGRPAGRPAREVAVHPRSAARCEGAEALDGPSLAAARGLGARAGRRDRRGERDRARRGDGAGAQHQRPRAARTGRVAAVYRKLHMFDVDVGGVSYRESAATAPGDEVVVARGAGPPRRDVGLLRPALPRALPAPGRRRAPRSSSCPAAFTAVTGRDHWEPLLRARAIENQAFVIAAGQHGRHDDGTVSHGRSMIVDPWGIVLAQAPDGEGLAVADLDFARLDDDPRPASRRCATAGRTSTAGLNAGPDARPTRAGLTSAAIGSSRQRPGRRGPRGRRPG